MWALKGLVECTETTQTNINGKWVPSRPENYKKDNMTLLERFKDAWAVFTCKAEAFIWPEGQ